MEYGCRAFETSVLMLPSVLIGVGVALLLLIVGGIIYYKKRNSLGNLFKIMFVRSLQPLKSF